MSSPHSRIILRLGFQLSGDSLRRSIKLPDDRQRSLPLLRIAASGVPVKSKVPPEPVYNWTGFYADGNAGWVGSSSNIVAKY